MAKNKKSVRKKPRTKSKGKPKAVGVRTEIAKMNIGCDWVKGLFVRLCTASVVLFVLMLCPKCLAVVQSINLWWYLVAAILFMAIHLSRRRCL